MCGVVPTPSKQPVGATAAAAVAAAAICLMNALHLQLNIASVLHPTPAAAAATWMRNDTAVSQ
jgi:hypothetical protein